MTAPNDTSEPLVDTIGVDVPFAVVEWAAQECEWQRSGERSVPWMVAGWLYAVAHQGKPITLTDVLTLGAIVEPRHNLNGIRQVPVRVGTDVKMHHDLVPAALNQLLFEQSGARNHRLIVEWYRQYEEIHPFRDGNGRTGNILYNWLRGTLDEPLFPPNLWADSRRYEGVVRS